MLVAFAALIGAAGLVTLRARRASSGGGGVAGVLAAAPADAWLLATVDVAAAWPLLKPAVGAAGGLAGATRVAGLGPLSAACGFEPLEHLRELMVALPEGGD